MSRTFRRLPADTHWTMKALELTTIRVAAPVVCFWAPVIVAVVTVRDWDMTMAGVITVLLVTYAGSQMGARLAFAGVDLPEAARGLRHWLRAALFWPFSSRVQTILLMLWAGSYPLGWKTVAIAMGSLVFGCVWSTHMAVWLWKKTGYLFPASEPTRSLVERVSSRTGVSCLAVYEADSTTANAYA
ncbi:MAG: hypothetical protein JWO08_2874, partial [Verrucomicrobiaceae bacterium]|nr:hypothetical protein [Verrucomicrobiaceae bacterium]